jgi:hypothetical protein
MIGTFKVYRILIYLSILLKILPTYAHYKNHKEYWYNPQKYERYDRPRKGPFGFIFGKIINAAEKIKGLGIWSKKKNIRTLLTNYLESSEELKKAYTNYETAYANSDSGKSLAEFRNELQQKWNWHNAAIDKLNQALNKEGIEKEFQVEEHYRTLIPSVLKRQ